MYAGHIGECLHFFVEDGEVRHETSGCNHPEPDTRISVLKIMIKIAISPGASLGPYNPRLKETHNEKSSEVVIPVLQHVKLHFSNGRVSVLKIMITIAIIHGPH